jgi:signal transduction histidine kinase
MFRACGRSRFPVASRQYNSHNRGVLRRVWTVNPKPDSSRRDRLTEWIRRLRPLIYLGCGLAFLRDLTQSDTLAFGVFYMPLVSTALLSRDRRTVWVLTGVAAAMVLVGTFLPDVNPHYYELVANRILSLLAIVTTALFVMHAQKAQQRLAEQTRRAEEAERLKTAFFTNLGQDIRVPLHAIIGLSELMKLDCPPSRRESLGHVQNATRRLLATIDNLIDLAQLERRALRFEKLELAAELRRVVKDMREHALERGVNLGLHMAEVTPPVFGDAWAARRIVENIVGNAVRFTEPGGTVTVSMTPREGGVAVAVSDDGEGIPEEVLARLEPDSALTGSRTEPRVIGVGLTLSKQLADATGARIAFESSESAGTTVTVVFPAFSRLDQDTSGR